MAMQRAVDLIALDQAGLPEPGDDLSDIVSNLVEVNVVSLSQRCGDLGSGSSAIGKFPDFAGAPIEREVRVVCRVEDYEVVVDGLFEHTRSVRAHHLGFVLILVTHRLDCTQSGRPASRRVTSYPRPAQVDIVVGPHSWQNRS